MIELNIPGHGELQLGRAVFDWNGTLATDGILPDAVRDRLKALSRLLDIFIFTADTHHSAALELKKAGLEDLVQLMILSGSCPADEEKLGFLRKIGSSGCIAFGNGRNDMLMLREAELSVAVIGREGCSRKAFSEADMAVSDISDAIDLLLKPKRLVAALRNL